MANRKKIAGYISLAIGVILLIFAGLIGFKVINPFEPFYNTTNPFYKDTKWHTIGRTAWFPVFGNTFVYNNTLQERREGDHFRYRIITQNGTIYQLTNISRLYNGATAQIANPTNPMSVEMAVQRF